MCVYMLVVNVCCNNCFKASLQQSFGKFYTEPVSLLWRHFAGSKGMYDVITLYGAIFLVPAPLGLHHVSVCAVELAVDRRLKNLPVFLALCLGLVKCIVNPIVQTGMNNNDLVIGHS